MRMLRYGGAGLLVEFGSPGEATAAYRTLRRVADDGRLIGVRELVPAARTVLLVGAPRREEITELLSGTSLDPAEAGEPNEVVLPVRYDGADLELVARTAQLSVDEVVRLHSGAEYTVAFCGFLPGFGYLTGVPEVLRQARLDEPRTSVPAGSVGLAGEFSGVYPRSSPGGWRLIGRTDEVLFDPMADRPARLRPGDRVRFEPL